MRASFRKQLEESGYLHMLLRPDLQRTAETVLLAKEALESRALWDGTATGSWQSRGTGSVGFADGAMLVTVPSRIEPEVVMAHYTGFGDFSAFLPVDGENWQGYNRIVCKIKPSCKGFHEPQLTMNLRNDGAVKIPDIFHREGAHTVNLDNDVWNDCIWEFTDLPRDKITELSFQIRIHGKERFGGDDLAFAIKDIRLERVENPDVSLGWQGNDGTISFSTTGYWAESEKTAVAQNRLGAFQLLDEETGNPVYSGEAAEVKNDKGTFGLLDFSGFRTPGRYRIRMGDVLTESFSIDSHVMEEAAWKVLNYIYSERCGYPVGGGHTSCHRDLTAEHGGVTLTYDGGWHDAGDVSQQTLQTGEVVQALFELAGQVKDDMLLYRRLVEEARWGLDFVLRSRFGDGYRAFSAGMCRWTDGFIGTNDDDPVRCHNRSIDNWILSGIQAYSGHCLEGEDPELAWVCINTAREDYAFALERFNEVGMETRVFMEHTHNASLSQYYAAASWSASMIYQACGEAYYAKEAACFAALLLDCQDKGEAGLPFTGFFYRDNRKSHIVHFNHQSREHLFIQALHALCTTQKDSAELPVWEDALSRYGGYLKALYSHSSPYGMIPSGVHRFDEPEDRDTFAVLHLEADYETDKLNYLEQLKAGIPVGESHCIRHFPVWFSFRGNTAILLSQAKGASLCGKYFSDDTLLEIAREQMYWLSGKNPFRQSLIYGEGSNYAQQYAALCGETVGEIPVGIQTRDNEDRPYWPMANCATYKEIWMTSAGHWLRLLADLY
ncbi:MAG: glycoside hydrolase family 9 protein [Oscillospiraceae bacterium]